MVTNLINTIIGSKESCGASSKIVVENDNDCNQCNILVSKQLCITDSGFAV